MMYAFAVVCLIIYLCCSLFLLIAVLFQLHLARKVPKANTASIPMVADFYPTVTIQVPVYNERYVIAYLLRALGKTDYPRDKFEIQVLDDSTDDTSLIIQDEVELLLKEGLRVKIFRRENRIGFKAGALQAALPFASGGFIAIFDADFSPGADVITRMTQHFIDPKVGMVQGRWVHRNLHRNALTRIQAFLLDSHFQVEQLGRAAADYFVSFNGTAGMWRKECIVDAGGWSADMLTEDIDLSYRAQIRGWKCRYDNNLTVESDLPEHITAFKLQQFRWAKGLTQAAIKHSRQVASASISSVKKMHAIAHLVAGISFVAVTGTMLMSLPVLIARNFSETFRGLSSLLFVTGVLLPLICVYYYRGTKASVSPKFYMKNLPLFLVVFMALSVQNCVAVLEAIIGKRSGFVRTPKLRKVGGDSPGYISNHWTYLNTVELFAAVYMLAGIVFSIVWSDYFLLSFFLMMLTGLAILLRPALLGLFRGRINGRCATNLGHTSRFEGRFQSN